MHPAFRHPLNDLAKERNRAAAERTLLAWIQNCLALIGFGAAFDRIVVALEERSPNYPPVERLFWVHVISLTSIAMGTILLMVAIYQHQLAVNWLVHPDLSPRRRNNLGLWVALAIALFGSIAWLLVLVL